jgi:hypothetical protein
MTALRRADTSRFLRRWVLGLSCGALAASGAAAQVSDPSAGAGVLMESYTFRSPAQVDVQKVSLLTVPISVRMFLAPQLEFGMNGAYASGSLTRQDGEAATVSGLTDTDIRLTYATAGDRLRVSGVALVPTGKSKLTAAEMDVMGVLAADLLPFAISNWGSGGGLGLSAAVALPVSDASNLGVSAGYVVARAYEPLSATTFAYRPGNQLQARAAADRTFSTSAKASLQLSYVHFSQDQNAGTNFYQSGDRLQAVGSVAFAAGARGTGLVYAGYLQRQQGQYTSVVQVTPAQNLVYAGTGFRQLIGGLVLVPTLDLRVVGNRAGVEQGRTISAGLGLEIPAGGVELLPLARARLGHVTVRTAQESDFTGFELGLSIRTKAYAR